MEYEIGKVYNRQRDIHLKYGGQQQGGIATPKTAPYIFLFTGDTGEQYGYKDGFDEEGVYLYTGEGQLGDMEFVRGNRSILDHVKNGKDLLLFKALGKGKGYRFLGIFTCSNYQIREAPDRIGHIRKVIVFHLLPLDEGIDTGLLDIELLSDSLEELRVKAYAASDSNLGVAGLEAKRTYWNRSQAVKNYVLARAKGFCESCKRPAPFLKQDGTPYLEPHHTRRLSDGGPDHPRWVGALCPNCHREIHCGTAGNNLNTQLQKYLEQIEK